MSVTRPELPIAPTRIAALPVDRRGYPVPWFVAYVDGDPDHRIMDEPKRGTAWKRSLCWICGQPLGGPTLTYVIGPMCAINRVSAEPPSHLDCCLYSVAACPFLSRPHAHRRDHDYPEGHADAPGLMLTRNPGVSLLWSAKRRTTGPFQIPGGGILFNIGEPDEVRWYCEGRPATRAEVEASIESGLPALAEVAAEQGETALAALEAQTLIARELLPAA